jgi:hypothetical protein
MGKPASRPSNRCRPSTPAASSASRCRPVICQKRMNFANDISSISCGWQRTVGDLNCRGNLYADQYDFYPLLPSASGDSSFLVCLESRSDSFSYRTHLPFESKVATLLESPNDSITLRIACRERCLVCLAHPLRCVCLVTDGDGNYFICGIESS